MDDRQSGLTYDNSIPTEPVVAATWRGKFDIPSRNMNINLAAHVSNKACLKVWEVATKMPESLYMEVYPRLDVWPESFRNFPPSEQNIALFFFPLGRDERLLHSLLTDAICTDFALKAMIGKAELLIFTSLELPEKLQRFKGKHYLWGIFHERQDDSSYRSQDCIYIQNKRARHSFSLESGNCSSFEEDGSPVGISTKYNHLVHAAQADKKGRQLDDAWKHAKPLDELRQKAECRYCGFVSSLGGISRLKAHLAGGNPRICLQGCDMVPPEVKKVMFEWFSEWVKNSKALWTKETQAQHGTRADRRGRPHDFAWKYARPLDMARQKAECRYCGFVSSHGGISRLKAHLGGGDPKLHVGACPRVPPDIKEALFVWLKTSNASKMEKRSRAGAPSDRRGRPLDDAWNHAKPLDDARQKTQCKYCGFVSLHGGISRLKAHLGGGCAQKQLQGCPKVPLEVERVMQLWFSEWAEKSMASWIKKSHETGRTATQDQQVDKRHHILQETLDETKNISLKATLQRLMEKKNVVMQKMESEILPMVHHFY